MIIQKTKSLLTPLLIRYCRHSIGSLDAVDNIIDMCSQTPNISEFVWAGLYWRKYSLESRIEKLLNTIEKWNTSTL